MGLLIGGIVNLGEESQKSVPGGTGRGRGTFYTVRWTLKTSFSKNAILANIVAFLSVNEGLCSCSILIRFGVAWNYNVLY